MFKGIFCDVLTKTVTVICFFVFVIRWISTLQDGAFGLKYSLKPSRLLKGSKFRDIDEDSEVEEDIDEVLKIVGVLEKNDRDFITSKMKKIVKNAKQGKGLHDPWK